MLKVKSLTNNVSPMLNGLDQISTHPKGIVNYQGNPPGMGNFCEGRYIVHDIFRIGDTLDIERFCSVIDSSGKCFRARICHPFDTDAELFEGDFELIVGTTIEVRTSQK